MTFLENDPVALSLVVYLARIVDVSIGTVRTILMIRGYRLWASILSFFEILIWIAAAGAVIRDLSAWYVAVAYAAGFATGSSVGIWIERKLALGMELVRVLSTAPEVNVARQIRAAGHSVIELTGREDQGRSVEVLFVVTPRRRLAELLRVVASSDPSAVYTISDVKVHLPASITTLSGAQTFRRRK